MTIFSLVFSILLVVLLTTRAQIHPFLALFAAALTFGFLTGMPLDQLIIAINSGFGETVGKIGFIITFGVIIGAFLENSGAAHVLTESLLNLVGRRNVTTAMAFIGYFISIPVFADSGFLLVSPLNKTLSRKAGTPVAASAIALALGLIVSHTMIPPTPGPVAAAGILGVEIGLVLLIGIPVTFLALIPVVIYSYRYVGRMEPAIAEASSEPDAIDHNKQKPGIVKSALPVVVPVLLIVLKSTLPTGSLPEPVGKIISFLGEPFIALFIGVLLSMTLPATFRFSMLSTDGWVGRSLRDAAGILLITGAGGTFGKVLQHSNLAEMASGIANVVNISIWLPFFLAALLKTAQGSSTVAIITTASILSSLMPALGFDTPIEKALVVLMIGSGSAVVCHANDSFFWVVTQLSGMSVKKGLRLFTPGTAVSGLSSAIIIFIIYILIQ